MGLFDKIKAYFNEELPSDTELKESSGSGEASDAEKTVRRKKRSKRKEINKLKDAVANGYLDTKSELGSVRAKHSRENERKTVQDFCEQLIDVSKHMEETKQEYKLVTEYLTDIQRIEELPVEIANELVATAKNIERLDNNRQKYLQSENLLTMEQYNTIANHEDEIIDTIKNLNEMELRDSMLKSDMGHLEGEKEDLRYMRSEYAEGIDRLRAVLITVLIAFLFTIGTMLVVALATKKNLTVYVLAVGLVAMLVFAVSYVKYIDLKSDAADSLARINRAISLLNKVKVKYINNVNALDYIYDKYGVNSCKELEYRYELYNTMVRDAKKYYQTNGELREQNSRLIEQLTAFGVEDPLVWTHQVHAIIDRREMVEIKHGLVVRRQKLRDTMETCRKIKDNAMIALRASVEANPGMQSLISEILTPYNIKVSDQ